MKPNVRLRNVRALITKRGRVSVHPNEIVLFRPNMQCFVCVLGAHKPNPNDESTAFAFEVPDVLYPVYRA